MKRRILIGVAAVLVLSLAGFAAYLGYAYHEYSSANLPGAYFDSNGVRIHYVEAGTGTPVILVHGLSVDLGVNWVRSGIFKALSKKYHVVALDLRGHGLSAKPHDSAQYGTELVEDIVRLMDHLMIQKAHVVGYSMGGFIALKMAVLHPDRMLSVVPCGAGWSANPDKDLAFMHTLGESIERGEGYRTLLERLQPVGRPVGPMQIRIASAFMSLLNDPKAIAAMLHSVDALRVDETALRNNKLPALALIGARDPLKPLADQLCDVMANVTEVVIPEANHFSTLSKPAYLAELEKFLAANSPAATAATATKSTRRLCLAKAA